MPLHKKRPPRFKECTNENKCPNNISETPIPDEWTIITAMEYILRISRNSELNEEFKKYSEAPLGYLNQTLGLSDIQCIVIALLMEEGEAMSWKEIAEYLGCTRLKLMTHSEDINILLQKGWLVRAGVSFQGKVYQGFKLEKGVVTELRNNHIFTPINIVNLPLQEFMDLLESRIDMGTNAFDIYFDNEVEWLNYYIDCNMHLDICNILRDVKSKYHRAMFLLCLADYAMWGEDDECGISFKTIDDLMPHDYQADNIRQLLRRGSLPLFSLKLIECKCEDGIVNPNVYVLSHSVKNTLLAGYTPSKSKCAPKKTSDSMLHSHSTISARAVYYNPTEEEAIKRISSILAEENYQDVTSRLEEKGMRKGITAIFYGDPGTGKTETVLQVARMTGRDIMRVEIAGLRDKWVGGSEKNIKSVFLRYKKLCEGAPRHPILLFNEADAIFNRRMEEATHSVDKMNNALQNIILQEMEDFEGILIATTNLTGALDKAFERRFLFKVEFHTPGPVVRKKIWKSMMGDHLSEEEATRLASNYELSGGAIENVTRRCTIDYILTGLKPTFSSISTLCKAELFSLKRPAIGF